MFRKTYVLFICLALVALIAVACAPAPTPAPTAVPPTAAPKATAAPATAAPTTAAPAQPYKGTTLRFLAANHAWMEAVKPLLPDFTAQTGINVTLEPYGETQLTQKLTTEFTAGGSDIDVFMTRPLQEAKLFAQNGWYADLNTFVNDSKKTPADYDFNDFSKGAVGTTTVGKALTAIPIVTEQEVLYYRKDLLEKAGIAVPKTLDDLKAAAAKLTDKNTGVYGFIARGQQSPAVTQFSSFLYSSGGDWFDLNTRKATLDTPEAIAAFKLYGDLLRNYGPPGVLNMSYEQAQAIFGQGKAAMYTDANSLYPNLLDPAKSQVAAQTGVAVFPAGPKGSVMYSVTSWGLGIAASSKKQDAAWEFVKYFTSKQGVMKTQGAAAVPGARNSVWNAPEGKAKFPADWVAATAASQNGRGYDRPLLVQVVKARDIIGQVIVTSISGGDVEAAAKQANKDLQALIDSDGK